MKSLLSVLIGTFAIVWANQSARAENVALVNAPIPTAGTIDKCPSGHCRLLETPFGTYRINDPAQSDQNRADVETVMQGNDRNGAAQQRILLQMGLLGTDMLRAGCKTIVDARCRVNEYSVYFECRDQFNFGSFDLSDCEKALLPDLPIAGETLFYPTSCTVDGRTRYPINLPKFQGSVDDALTEVFDTRCIEWREDG